MRISIFAKLALTFLVTIAGLVVFLGVSAAKEFDHSFAALVQDRGETVESGIRLEVNLLLDEVGSRLSGMEENFDFRNSLIDRLEERSPKDELIERIVELRNISALEYLWLVSPDGILLAAGHDDKAFDDNMLDPGGETNERLSRAINGETVRAVDVETISAKREFVAEVYLPVTKYDRFLEREQVIGVLWGAQKIDNTFITRAANLANAKIVAVAPDVNPIASWLDSSEILDPAILESIIGGSGEITLDGDAFQIATLDFPGSEPESTSQAAVLHLLIPKSDLISSRLTLLRSILVELGFGGLVAILLAFLIAKSITFPIERLKHAVTAMASGEMTGRVEVHSRDEVEDLVKSFNTMADELDTNTRRLVEAEKLSAWREVARRLAHEIKNPLSPIKLSIQNLNRVFRGHPEAFETTLKDTSETILEEVDRLKTLADEFSNFARMPKPVLIPNSVADILRGSVALFDKPEIGVKIEFDCPDDLPMVQLDRDAMSRVFTNLIKNAVEAMVDGKTKTIREGGIQVKVLEVQSGNAPWVQVRITDHGVGMDQVAIKQSFNPYFTTKRTGSGLGLAIVQSIVSEHRGRIRIDSEVGKGTMVTVELPAD